MKAAELFEAVNRPLQAEFARNFRARLFAKARQRLVDLNTMTALGSCQTSQAMAIYYDLFESGEKQTAFERLLKLIERDGTVMDVGVLGGRVQIH